MQKPKQPARPASSPGEQPRPVRKSPAQALLDNAPWMPAPYELADVSAFQALARGDADADMQKRALKWLIEVAAGTYDMSYRPGPGGDRDTDFAEGRRYVGSQVVKLLRLNISYLRKSEPNSDPHEPKS